MKSGLRDRNNLTVYLQRGLGRVVFVSMKSGLRDRNNSGTEGTPNDHRQNHVSMKSGLRDRNNGSPRKAVLTRNFTSFCERSAPQTPATPLC